MLNQLHKSTTNGNSNAWPAESRYYFVHLASTCHHFPVFKVFHGIIAAALHWQATKRRVKNSNIDHQYLSLFYYLVVIVLVTPHTARLECRAFADHGKSVKHVRSIHNNKKTPCLTSFIHCRCWMCRKIPCTHLCCDTVQQQKQAQTARQFDVRWDRVVSRRLEQCRAMIHKCARFWIFIQSELTVNKLPRVWRLIAQLDSPSKMGLLIKVDIV